MGTGRHCDDVEADVTRSSRNRVWAFFSAFSQDSRSLVIVPVEVVKVQHKKCLVETEAGHLPCTC